MPVKLLGIIIGFADASYAAKIAEVSGGFESVFLSAPDVETVLADRLEVGWFHAMAVRPHLDSRSASRDESPSAIL